MCRHYKQQSWTMLIVFRWSSSVLQISEPASMNDDIQLEDSEHKSWRFKFTSWAMWSILPRRKTPNFSRMPPIAEYCKLMQFNRPQAKICFKSDSNCLLIDFFDPISVVLSTHRDNSIRIQTIYIESEPKLIEINWLFRYKSTFSK